MQGPVKCNGVTETSQEGRSTLELVQVVMLHFSILLHLILEFISSCVPSTMQQHKDLKLNPFQICQCTTRFGLLGDHQVR
jgi:hypothetical protein